MLARYLDDLNVQVLDGSAEGPVVLLCPHLLHRVEDSGRRGGRLHRSCRCFGGARLYASLRCEEVAHERLLQRRLGTTNLLVAQLLQARLGSDELAIDRFEVASISFISRVCVAMTGAQCIVHLGRLLVQLAHFGRQRLDLVVLGDVVGLLPRLIALIAQATELLNVVVILSKAGRLDDDSAAPSCYSGSRLGDRGAAGSARLGLAGLGQRSLARHLVPGIAADTAAPIRGDRVAWACLTLVYHSATCGGRLGEIFGDLGGRAAWAGRKIVEFFGTHLQGSISTGKCFPPVWKAIAGG